MSSQVKCYTIPERFTFDEDTYLKVFLRENDKDPVAISAKNLRRMDSLLMQYLISAAIAWRKSGLEFCLTEVSEEIGDALTLLGVNDDILSWKVAA